MNTKRVGLSGTQSLLVMLALTANFVCVQALQAQERRGQEDQERQRQIRQRQDRQDTSGARGSLNQRFNSGGPQVGEPLPDVMLYDGDGEPVNLSSIKGSYSVLVFGCLT